jgi:hypothetical protein
MGIEDFNFFTKQIGSNQLQCSLINKESNIKYSIIINANGTPPDSWIFDRFVEDRGLKNFWIDIESQVVDIK